MARPKTSWGDAAAMLAEAGVEAVTAFYGRFTGDDERAALTVPMRLQDAVTRKDADAFADVFAENGSLVQYDDELKNREEIRAYMKAAFAGPFKDNDVAGRSLRLSFLTDDVALLTEEAGVLLPGEQKAAPERLFYATWVIHRVAPGRLELLSFHQSPIHS
ncbi:hypothetical protein AMES_5470 [Amycolatopsis mediterranei S699]|uniref:SnoaL-like domain-containing protein n=2 Tax=Amycolatopsis mediterranei TaxID=33910 RepID=A0A0H3D8J1_AMYMU|nr:SgcJ/EcaC family oxidoreductase [Amycolatopsis mediterranei]ADJ47295.1 conserved hypothetical protein [Amycolatopsis mediterranei U32]AEK44122.1 hypothetical protein RAM_28225 [Amycolatopsis mediterranei S699]AFO79006.1 hypothetical protein AMES_5470 [Amycolatopsis mediterranei S699]AGT86134.1 hypothetical protein B737_5470 [Amycolatopsis mediterranei RB]KDO12518.1 hypothetical protein DV26_02415 [Amycolatopsis mediterranei]